MSFPKYDRYKNSGVEWLGEVPEHWEVGHVKRLATKITDGSHISPETENGVYAFISTKDVRNDSLDFDNCLRTSVENYEYLVRTGCKPIAGDVLFSKDGTIGRTVVIKEDRDFVVASSLIIISPDQNILSSVFLNYLCQSSTIASQVECFVKGAGLPRLSIQNLLRIIGVFPPLPEQRSIATFLDRETTKIDELIAEQRQLIDLLKEKRQAVISHAVTKGLNSDAPMKDSAIEWLGEVPEHWEITQLKHVVAIPITDGPHETPEFLDEGVSFVSAEAISSGMINFSKIRGFISEEVNKRYSQKYSPKLHDIYLIKSGATTGTTAIVESRTDFNIWSPLAAIRCSEIANPYFVLNFMRSKNFQEAITLNWSFGTQQNIGMRVIENLAHTLPPLPEQRSIAAFLDRETAKFDELIAEAHHAIALLQERRTALISAAVTGKIDVRSLV